MGQLHDAGYRIGADAIYQQGRPDDPDCKLAHGRLQTQNVADATARTHYASYGQAQDSTPTYLTGVAGVDTITASVTGLAAYAAGQTFRFISAGANTGAVTLNVNAIGAKAITKQGDNGTCCWRHRVRCNRDRRLRWDTVSNHKHHGHGNTYRANGGDGLDDRGRHGRHNDGE